MDLAPGTLLADHVRLRRPLEQGGWGSVWEAEHLRMKAPVAVTVRRAGKVAARKSTAGQLREAMKRCERLRGPHVARLLAHGVSDGLGLFMVHEWIAGESLVRRLASAGPLSLAESARLLRQIGKVLDQAHALDVVHRNIRPSKLYLVEAGEDLFAKVAGFGLADLERLSGGGTAHRLASAPPDPSFLSPELLRNAENVDGRCDLWALAVAMYQALVGELPFRADSPRATGAEIAAGRFEPPSSRVEQLPAELDDWFRRCLHVQPERRLPSAGLMVEAFDNICEEARRAGAERGQERILERGARASLAFPVVDVGSSARVSLPPPAPSEPPPASAADGLPAAAADSSPEGPAEVVERGDAVGVRPVVAVGASDESTDETDAAALDEPSEPAAATASADEGEPTDAASEPRDAGPDDDPGTPEPESDRHQESAAGRSRERGGRAAAAEEPRQGAGGLRSEPPLVPVRPMAGGRLLGAVALVAVGLFLGWLLFRDEPSDVAAPAASADRAAERPSSGQPARRGADDAREAASAEATAASSGEAAELESGRSTPTVRRPAVAAPQASSAASADEGESEPIDEPTPVEDTDPYGEPRQAPPPAAEDLYDDPSSRPGPAPADVYEQGPPPRPAPDLYD